MKGIADMVDRQKELRVAVEAVRAASRVCVAVQKRMVSPETLEKKDRSPVTVADFASQAIVCACLEKSFGGDAIVGEEDASELREDAGAAVRQVVVEQVRSIAGEDVEESQVLDWIDRGGSTADISRYWTLDPIDGTKGFLRGEQYAVALALIEGGEVVLGVLGCPNLPVLHGDAVGALFTGAREHGAYVIPLFDESQTTFHPISVSKLASPSEARFCESVESGHSDQGQSAQIAQALGITSPPCRIDSQCKYATVARGEASIYLRMPTRADYREKIWDHAAGKIVVEEAGGKVSDIEGKPLDFTHGRCLEENRGVVATCGSIHDAVIEAVSSVVNAV